MSQGRAAARAAVVALCGAALFAGVALAEPLPGFDVSSESPTAGDTVTFTAHDACVEPVTCTWDFGDGSGGASGPSVQHVYAEAGLVTASLTTDDPGDEAGARTTDRSLVVLPAPLPNRPPVAELSASTLRPGKGEVVQFDSSASSDPDGDVITRAWDLDGDGTFGEPGDEPRQSQAYSATGPVTVSVRVTDSQGESATAFVGLEVVNRPPTVSIAPVAPLSQEDVTFTATAQDPDGTVAAYAWDFDGDGFDDGDTRSVTTSFATPGPRSVRVRVADDDGATGQAVLAVTVGNRAPTASFTYTPNTVLRGAVIAFTATAADPDGTIAAYAWDLDGDGSFETPGASVVRKFAVSLSAIRVSLRVTDDLGKTAESTAVIVPGNLLPTATVTATQSTPLVGEPVLFTSNAVDPDGVGTVSYAWDLDGIGDFDDGTGPTLAATFTRPGPAVVRVRVTDGDNASVTAEHEVAVQPRPAPATFESGTQPEAPASGPSPAQPPSAPAKSAAMRAMTPWPVVRFAGALSPAGARFTLFTVTAPRGARIAASCRGTGCPRAQAARGAGVTRLRALQRNYRAGVRLVVRVTQRNRIGKHVRITIRKGKPPKRLDSCLWPGSRTPRPCP